MSGNGTRCHNSPMPTRLIRIAILSTALAVTVALGLVPWPLARAELEQRLLAALMRATGLSAETAPGARIALLPSPRIILSEARFSSADRAITVTSTKIRADLSLLPLLAGQISVDGIDLTAPQITLDIADGDLPPLIALPTEGPGFSALRATPKLTLRDGSIYVRSGPGLRTLVRSVDITIEERDPGDPLVFAGRLRWRGEAVELSATWPLPGTAPQPRPVSTRIISGMGSLRFEGLRQPGPIGPVEGRLDLEAGSLGLALDWLGEASPLGWTAERFRLSGEAVLAASGLTMPALSLSIDAERLDGAAQMKPGPDGRWGLSATLAGTRLDLDRMMRRADLPGFLPENGKATESFRLGHGAWRSADLRLSLEQARIGKTRLDDVALQLLAAPGKLDLSLARASGFKGTVKARLIVQAEAASRSTDLRLSASAERVDLAQLMNDLADSRRLTGTGSLTLALDGAGESLRAAMATSKGRVSLVARQGELVGVSLAELARRAERQQFTALREIAGGRSAYETLSLGGPIQDGVFEITEGQIAGQGYRLNISGVARLAERQLSARAALSGTSGPARLAFDITGPIGEPRITPDIEALLRRPSAANAPAPPAPQ